MLGIPYIKEVFTAILQHSMVMQGRLHVCPQWGSEINSSNLEELTKAATGTDDPLFPAAFMLPPTVTGDLAAATPSLLPYPITLLFLCSTYTAGGNQVKQEDPLTGRSSHSITDDWHDMQRCAQEFMRTLQETLELQEMLGTIHISQRVPQSINYITQIGGPRLSGVALNFTINLFTSCVGNEDYQPGTAATVQLPVGDSHPAHLH